MRRSGRSDGAGVPYALKAQRTDTPLLTHNEMQIEARGAPSTPSARTSTTRSGSSSARCARRALLDDTIICFTADHGDMLGNHGLWAKRLFYEASANVPMILAGLRTIRGSATTATDDRLVGRRTSCPRCSTSAGIPIPRDGRGPLDVRRAPPDSHIYGEDRRGGHATRMMRDGRYKLIYYPVGNRSQLFDVTADPREMIDLSRDPEHADRLQHLTQILVDSMYGSDEKWIKGGQLRGEPDREF